MAKKKNVSKEDLLSWYVSYVLEHNREPESIYKFCKSKQVNIEESTFYTHFGSFEALRSAVFESFFENTILVLNKSEDYQKYDAKNKLLSFYYTFFEILTANRSYVIYALDLKKHNLKMVKTLHGLHNYFKTYIENLEIELLDLKKDKFQKVQQKALCESAWLQFLATLKFWMEDSSPSFEKTEVFIEKSVKASFDVIHIAPVKSILDLGKFLFKEKMSLS